MEPVSDSLEFPDLTALDPSQPKLLSGKGENNTLLTHLQLATSSAGVGTWMLEVDTGKLEWSALHKKMWGYDELRNDLFYKEWYSVIHPEDQQRCLLEVERSLNERRFYEIDYRILPADGRPMRWMRSVGKYHFDADGKAITMTGISMDITERRLSQEALQKREKQFRSTFYNPAIGIGHINLDGHWLMVNDRWCAITGYSRDELLQMRFQDITHVEDLSEDIRLLKELLAGEQASYTLEKRYYHKQGNIIWANLTRTLLRDEEGRPDYFITFVEDITEKKRAEAELKESNERLQAALDAAQTGTFQWNIQTNELSWDSNLDKLFGLNSETTVRSLDKFISCVHPDDREGVIERCTQCALTGANFEMEFRVIYPNGSLHWLYDKGKTFLDNNGKPSYMTGACVDITERKEAEAVIRESESRFRTLVNSLPQMVWIRNADGSLQYASQSWMDYSGLTDADEAWKAMVHPEDWKPIMEQWNLAVPQQKAFQHEVRLKDKNGFYYWYNSIAVPFKDKSGLVTQWIGALTNIHVQKTFSEKLEKEVQQRTKELQRSNEDLQQFAHVSSHDLKEPVRKIRMFESRLRDEFGSSLPQRALNYLDKIESAANRVHSMIEGVLKYASTLSDAHIINEQVNVHQLINEIESDLEILIALKEAVIIKNNLGIIEGSSLLLYQLFYNLINNSLKFCKPNLAPIITISSAEFADHILITVEDNDIGFSQEQADLIFQTFTRLNARDQYEGTGLGLSLCKKIAERHGGSIKAEGIENESARFILSLPMKHEFAEPYK